MGSIGTKIAKHRVILGWGLEYLNLLLIPLIAADVLQRHLLAEGYIGNMPFVIFWAVLVVASWAIGTIAVKYDLIGRQSKFETDQILRAAGNHVASKQEE